MPLARCPAFRGIMARGIEGTKIFRNKNDRQYFLNRLENTSSTGAREDQGSYRGGKISWGRNLSRGVNRLPRIWVQLEGCAKIELVVIEPHRIKADGHQQMS